MSQHNAYSLRERIPYDRPAVLCLEVVCGLITPIKKQKKNRKINAVIRKAGQIRRARRFLSVALGPQSYLIGGLAYHSANDIPDNRSIDVILHAKTYNEDLFHKGVVSLTEDKTVAPSYSQSESVQETQRLVKHLLHHHETHNVSLIDLFSFHDIKAQQVVDEHFPIIQEYSGVELHDTQDYWRVISKARGRLMEIYTKNLLETTIKKYGCRADVEMNLIYPLKSKGTSDIDNLVIAEDIETLATILRTIDSPVTFRRKGPLKDGEERHVRMENIPTKILKARGKNNAQRRQEKMQLRDGHEQKSQPRHHPIKIKRRKRKK